MGGIGGRAVELFKSWRPDVVLLDLVMKGMYGLDVLAKIREMDPAAKVIVVSAESFGDSFSPNGLAFAVDRIRRIRG